MFHKLLHTLVVFAFAAGLLLTGAAVQAMYATDPAASTEARGAAAPSAASITIDKTPDIQYLRTGETAVFRIYVTNNGTVDLTNVTVTDAAVPACNKVIPDSFMTAGSEYSYQCSVVVTEDLTNHVDVTGTPPTGGDVTASDDAVVDIIVPGISIEKGPDMQYRRSGATATFDMKVTNTGDVFLDNVTVSDPNAPNCDRSVGTLTAKAVYEYQCTATITADLSNEAAVTGDVPNGEQVQASDTAQVELIEPQIALSKWPDLQYANAGQPVRFTISITNTGDIALNNVTVTDPNAPNCAKTIGDLAVDGSTEYDCELKVTADVTNEASVTAKDPNGDSVQASDSAQVDVFPNTYTYDDVPSSRIRIYLLTRCMTAQMITRTFTVADDFLVGDVDLGFNADHEFRSHIWAFLTSPSGTKVELTTDLYSEDGNKNYDMMLDDASPNPQNDGNDDNTASPYYDRTAKPFRSLSAFNGEPAKGDWKLEICDKYPIQYNGYYNRSRLILRDTALWAEKSVDQQKVEPGADINYTVSVRNYGAGVFRDASVRDELPAEVTYNAGTLSANFGTATEDQGVITWEGDLPAKKTLEITFQGNVSIQTAALITNTAVFSHPNLSLPISPKIATQLFAEQDHLYTNEADIPIPDGAQDCVSPIQSQINVPDDFYIGDLRVGISAEHTARSDLVITLTTPSGVDILLLSGQGTNASNLDAMVSDAGPADAFQEVTHDIGAPYYDKIGKTGGTGAGVLSTVDGEKSAGTWTLTVCDDFQVDTGTLLQWSLFFKEADVWLGYDTDWHTASNWNRNKVPDSTSFALILGEPEGGNFPVLAAGAEVSNLMLKPGASTDLVTYNMTAEDYVSNRGTLKQIREVASTTAGTELLHMRNIAGTAVKYYGAVITPTVSMGDVDIEIRGNPAGGCTSVASDAFLSRCFNIAPTTETSATIKFYFTEKERNYQDASSLQLWERGASPRFWRPVGSDYAVSESALICDSAGGIGCWLQATGVQYYPNPVLGSATPPAVVTAVAGGGLQFSWSHAEAGVDHYELWWATNPFFSLTDSGVLKLTDVATNTNNSYTYTDTASGVGKLDINQYYILRTVYSSTLATEANVVGDFDLPLFK